MDIVVVEEVQDGVNILYCKLKVNDNTIKVCQKMVCIYIREHHGFVLNILSQHTELERVYILLLKTQQKIICLNKKTMIEIIFKL